MVRTAAGLIQAKLPDNAAKLDSDPCPFGTTRNEDNIAAENFAASAGIKWEKRIGYYLKLYAGAVRDDTHHWNSSSGGITSWLLQTLLTSGEIDAVLHVGAGDEDPLFDYQISKTSSEIYSRAKSRYYPTHFTEALRTVQRNPTLRYAFVGVPCFVKAARLLCIKDPILQNSIKYFIAIFCGHMKSESFAQLLAWQQGIPPHELKSINFREKNKNRIASQYSIKVASDTKRPKPVLNKKLYGTDWGLGYFKPKACDWCDDVAGETADFVCGDAWLPQYESNSKGTNIIIVRRSELLDLLNAGMAQGEIVLEEISHHDVIASQAANYRHRHEGLSLRIAQAERADVWHPQKRVGSGDFEIDATRKKIYDLRVKLAEQSHTIFLEAKKRNSLLYFLLKMAPLEFKYYVMNRRLVKGTARWLLTLPRIVRTLLS